MKTLALLIFLTQSIYSQIIPTFTFEHQKPGVLIHCGNNIGGYIRGDFGSVRDNDLKSTEVKLGTGASFKLEKASILIGYANTQHYNTTGYNYGTCLELIPEHSIEFGFKGEFTSKICYVILMDMRSFQTLIGIGVVL